MESEETPENAGETDVLKVIGTFGPWQRRIFVVFLIVNLTGVWHNFAVTFLAPNLEYHCVSPPPPLVTPFLNNGSLFRTTLNSTAPLSTRSTNSSNVDQCYVISNASEHSDSGEGVLVPCTEWEYDLSFYKRTIVDEWNLVCKREWLVSFAKSAFMIGFLVANVTFGQMADWIGRFPTAIVCYVITVVSGILSVFSSSYIMFVILRVFQAFGRTGLSNVGYVLIMEVIGREKRTMLAVALQVGWSIGMILLPGIAWLIRPWMWLQLAVSIPFVPLACIYWLISESPRWLMAQGKKERFDRLISKAAKMNGRELNEVSADLLKFKVMKETENGAKTSGLVGLLRASILRKRMLCIAYLWLVYGFVYYSIGYNTNDLGGNPYLNFFLFGCLELLSYVIMFFAIRSVGRRITVLVSALAGGVACAALMFVQPDDQWLIVPIALVGVFFFAGGFAALYPYTAELFPTMVRNSALGTGSMSARIGSLIAPFSREFGRLLHRSAPYGLSAALTISCALVVLLLPETKGREIPDVLEDVEEKEERNEIPLA